ncbi:glucoamylase [Cryptococcus deuterogattii LA55]|nr:glucoamylase [Cryptococcus deuterogattii LA55]KIR93127.1 glucoamylase [Cryptococcus deuterogattii CBS 10090]
MGILTRIRRRSSLAAQTQHLSSSSPLASQPAPSATLSIPAVAPDSISTGSVGSRIPKKPWKKKHDEGSLNGSSNKKGKGKTKAENDEVLGGPKYGDFPTSLGPTSSLSVINAPTTHTDGPSSQLYLSPPGNGSLAGGSNSVPGSSEKIEKRRSEASEIIRPSSEISKQDGGILGKLNFEDEGDRKRKMSNSAWMKDVEGLASSGSPSERPNASISNFILPLESSPVVTSSSRAITPDPNSDQRQPLVSTTSGGSKREEDPVEILESAEKKHRFWKGKGKSNRHSRVMSDSFQLDRSESPIPGKIPSSSTGPDLASVSRNSVDLDQPHSQQLRRPSSSFFSNPFHRSSSHASEIPSAVEDGSFQLKGFRHVSGMSDVEGAGKLEGYLSHVKRESVAALNVELPAAFTAPNSPVAYTSPKPTAIPLSRPASVTHSLTSVDDMVSPNRVSVAAFKKGLRRQSNGPMSTMSDMGHGTPVTDSGDEDDDVPLGKRIVSQPLPRPTSSPSLSNMRDLSLSNLEGTASNLMLKQLEKQTSEKEVSSQEPLAFQAKAYSRTSSGFVVKSRSPMANNQDVLSSPVSSLTSLAAGFPVSLDPTVLASSTRARTPSANVGVINLNEALPPSTDNKELLTDGHFSAGAPSSDQVTQRIQEFPFPIISQTTEELTKVAIPPPLATARQPSVTSIAKLSINVQSSISPPKQPMPPPVQHIDVLQPPHDISPTLLGLNLPLPPDQMPDTPPKAPVPLSELPRRPGSSSEGSASPSTQRKRMSLLEEPMKYLSGLWVTSPAGEDGSDPVFAINSGDEPQSPMRSNRPDITSWYAPQDLPKRQTSVSPPPLSPAERIRSPLSERLADVATSAISTTKPGRGLQKPVMEKLKTSVEDLSPSDNHKSLVSDFTLASIPQSGPRPFSSFMKPGPVQPKPANDESESDTEGGASVSTHQRQISRTVSLASQQSVRRIPGGPRQPMRQSRIVSMPITNSHLAQKSHEHRRHAEKDANEDEPLAKIKHRSSKSSLTTATAAKFPSYGQTSLPTPPTSVTNTSISSSSPQERRKPLIEFGPAAPGQSMMIPRPHDSVLSAPSSPFDKFSTPFTDSMTTSGKGSLPSPISGQVRFDSPERKRPSGIPRKTTSPEISKDNVNGNAVEVYDERQRHQNDEQNSDSRQRRRSDGALHHLSPYDPPVQARMGMQGMPNPQDMSSEAFLTWQKHQWQMHYLAAAYRASEEEWQRQSSVSMSINNHPSTQSAPFPMQHMPLFPPNMNMNMMNMGMGIPMAYGYPALPQFQGHMFNSYLDMPQMQNQIGGGGGYSYGTGTQSVFDRGFGPPPAIPSAIPSQQRQHNPQRRASSDQQGAQYTNTPHPHRRQDEPYSTKGRSASALGTHSNANSPPTMSKRPSSVFKGLLGEREKVELQQGMARQAQEKLDKQKQWSKERARGEATEGRSPPPPSSWTRVTGDLSEGATPRKPSRSGPTVAN